MGDTPYIHRMHTVVARWLSPVAKDQGAVRAGRIHGAEPPAGRRNIAPRYRTAHPRQQQTSGVRRSAFAGLGAPNRIGGGSALNRGEA